MLSKEHILKGCELVENYEWYDNKLCYSTLMETRGIGDCEPLYRDFLQLVIEGINREVEDNYCSYYIIQRPTGIQIKIYSGKYDIPDKHISFKDCDSITEAKEKAIIYVFDNMEVE